jgi:DNA-binding MarR family transcriptional regulator
MTVLSPGQWLRLVVHPPLPCAVVFEEHAGKRVGAGPVATRGSKFSGAERGDDRDDAVNAHVQSGTGNREVNVCQPGPKAHGHLDYSVLTYRLFSFARANENAPARLQMLSTLSAVSEAEFATLRAALDVSDSVLSKHISTLADAGYVRSRKGVRAGRRTTWIGLTSEGRDALREHVAALRRLIDMVD